MKFFLKTEKTKGQSNLYCEYRKVNPKLRFILNTKVKVNIENWRKSEKNANAKDRYYKTDEGSKVKTLLDDIESRINNLASEGEINCENDRSKLTQAIDDVIFAEVRKEEEEETLRLQCAKDAENNREKAERSTILGFYHYFMNGIANGQILHNNGYRYRSGSITTWKSFEKQLKDYVPYSLMTFDDITIQFRDGFASHLADKGYMQNTINKHVSAFQCLCRLSSRYGYNNNAITLQGWQAHEAKKDERKNAIYLTDEELNALYEMELNEDEGKIRDIFLVGCFTTQRYSDFSRISKEMAIKQKDGSIFLELIQKKTNKEVFIPVFDDRLMKILERYNFNVPYISDHQMNGAIKDILYKLSSSVESLNEEFKSKASARDYNLVEKYQTLLEQERKGTIDLEGRKYLRKLKSRKKKDNIPSISKDGFILKKKWALVTTHTARRSGITNLVKTSKLSNRQIMSVTGHTTEKIFEHYIKMTGQETAQQIMDIMKDVNKGK